MLTLSTIYYFLTFVFGTFFGSFLNLVSDRVPKDKPIFTGRSECEFCHKKLLPKNLVPILSYVFQGGKCSFCKKHLSIYYPLSEFVTGLLYMLAAKMSGVFEAFTFGSTLDFVFLAVIFSFYIIIFLTDTKFFIIPTSVIYSAVAFVVLFFISTKVFALYNLRQTLLSDTFNSYLLKAGYLDNKISYILHLSLNTFLSSLAIGAFFYFLVWITKEKGMGGGDVRLGFLIGLVNGFTSFCSSCLWIYPSDVFPSTRTIIFLNIMSIFLAFFIGAVYSVILMVLKRTTMKDTVPFGPFLIIGSFICLLYGSDLLNWYFNLL